MAAILITIWRLFCSGILLLTPVPYLIKYSDRIQNSIIFGKWGWFREKNMSNLTEFGFHDREYRSLKIRTDDNIELGIWVVYRCGEFSLNATAIDTIVYVHGSSFDRDKSDRIHLYKVLRAHFHIITFDYRGFGDSSNAAPSEQGAVNDTLHVLKWTRNVSKSRQVYVWGHSLGAAIAVETLALLNPNPFRKLILEAAFNNLRAEIPNHNFATHFKNLPIFDYFITEPISKNGHRFATNENIRGLNASILMLHAEDDTTIPLQLGLQLFWGISKIKDAKMIIFDKEFGFNHENINEYVNLTDILISFGNDSCSYSFRCSDNCINPHLIDTPRCPICFQNETSTAEIMQNSSQNKCFDRQKHRGVLSSKSSFLTYYCTYLCLPSGFAKTTNFKNFWMISIVLLLTAAFGLGVPLALTINSSASFEDRLETAKYLLAKVPLVDGHNDLPWNIRKFLHNQLKHFDFNSDFRNLTPWSTSIWSHTDLPRLKQGLVSAQFWAAYVPCEAQDKDAVQITLEQIDVIRRFTDFYNPPLTFCTSSQDILDSFENQHICSLIGVEGGHSLSNSLSVLRSYYNLGVRYLTLTSTCNTRWFKKTEQQEQKTIIMEMNRLGMIIDLSHVSVKTMTDTLETTKAPVIFSHSSVYSLCNSTRNVPDFVLKKLADNHGLIMINFYSRFITCTDYSTIYDVVDHINHVRKVAGIESVGIGAGFDGINFTPKGLDDVSSYPALFAELIGTGQWTNDDLAKLAGLNFLRVFRSIEKVKDDFRKANVAPYEDFLLHNIDNNCSTKDLF